MGPIRPWPPSFRLHQNCRCRFPSPAEDRGSCWPLCRSLAVSRRRDSRRRRRKAPPRSRTRARPPKRGCPNRSIRLFLSRDRRTQRVGEGDIYNDLRGPRRSGFSEGCVPGIVPGINGSANRESVSGVKRWARANVRMRLGRGYVAKERAPTRQIRIRLLARQLPSKSARVVRNPIGGC